MLQNPRVFFFMKNVFVNLHTINRRQQVYNVLSYLLMNPILHNILHLIDMRDLTFVQVFFEICRLRFSFICFKPVLNTRSFYFYTDTWYQQHIGNLFPCAHLAYNNYLRIFYGSPIFIFNLFKLYWYVLKDTFIQIKIL